MPPHTHPATPDACNACACMGAARQALACLPSCTAHTPGGAGRHHTHPTLSTSPPTHPQDYINYHLTGEMVASVNNFAVRWHGSGGPPTTLLRALGLEDLSAKWPPRVVQLGERIGRGLTQRWAPPTRAGSTHHTPHCAAPPASAQLEPRLDWARRTRREGPVVLQPLGAPPPAPHAPRHTRPLALAQRRGAPGAAARAAGRAGWRRRVHWLHRSGGDRARQHGHAHRLQPPPHRHGGRPAQRARHVWILPGRAAARWAMLARRGVPGGRYPRLVATTPPLLRALPGRRQARRDAAGHSAQRGRRAAPHSAPVAPPPNTHTHLPPRPHRRACRGGRADQHGQRYQLAAPRAAGAGRGLRGAQRRGGRGAARLRGPHLPGSLPGGAGASGLGYAQTSRLAGGRLPHSPLPQAMPTQPRRPAPYRAPAPRTPGMRPRATARRTPTRCRAARWWG